MRTPIVPEKIKEIIPDHELAKKAQRVAHLHREVQMIEDDIKAYKKTRMVELDSKQAQALELLEKIRLGYEYVSIECFVVRDYEESEVYFIRTDTCELIRQRPMNSDEKQMEIEDAEDNVTTWAGLQNFRKKLQDGETMDCNVYHGLLMDRHPGSKALNNWLKKTKSIRHEIPFHATETELVRITLTK
jgi:hypothetical protein